MGINIWHKMPLSAADWKYQHDTNHAAPGLFTSSV